MVYADKVYIQVFSIRGFDRKGLSSLDNIKNKMEKYKGIKEHILAYHRGKMTKREDKAEEEKRIISELWKKTEKDDNEYGALLGGKTIKRVNGDKNQIDEGDWSKVIYYIYDNPKVQFDFYHTHSEWDSPLSWSDIATFLYIRNLHSMTAITEDHKYTITRTKTTPVIDYEQRDEVIEKAIAYHQEEKIPTTLKETTASLPPKPNDLYFFFFDAQREAMCDVIRQLAREYNFIYEEEEL